MSMGLFLANLKELFLDPRPFLLNKLIKSVSSGLGRRTDNDPSVSFDADGDRSSPVSRSNDVISKVFVRMRGRLDGMLVIYSRVSRLDAPPSCLWAGAGRKADPIIVFTSPGSPALWAGSFINYFWLQFPSDS